MSHLSTPEAPWGKPFTNKRYVHPPFAENIVTVWPSSMVLVGEITAENPHNWMDTASFGHGFSGELPSAGVIFTLKRDSDLLFRQRELSLYKAYTWQHELMPQQATVYRTRRDGVPIHALTKPLDAVTFREEVFCDEKRVSTTYIRVELENAFGTAHEIELGVLVRTGPEFFFTGCMDPDGYRGYEQTRSRWDAAEMTRYRAADGYLTDGTYRLYFDATAGFTAGGENDLTVRLALAPYEKRTFTFAFTRSKAAPLPYRTARRAAEAFWKQELGRAQYIPDKKGIEPLFYNFLAQQLQMFACPRGKDYTILRQGATQRFHWPEAKETVKSLMHIGGYADYLDAVLAHYFNDLQETDGENAGRIHYEHVPWNSRTAAALEMFAYAVRGDEAVYDRYLEKAMAAFRWIERERARSASIEGAVAGIFPPGVATDNSFAGAQQWTFADTAMLRGYACFLDVLEAHHDAHAAEVRAAYDDYFGILHGIFNTFADAQKDSEFLYLPRDPKNTPELEAGLNRDAFYYMFPNEALAAGLAGYGTAEAEKVIHTYSHGGQAKNGLIYPTYRSVTGTGRTWYTTWSEHSRYLYYRRAGNRAECKKLLDALLRYNVTTEYYQCERYDDHDAYIAPWMPNASANGRVLDMLFDYYGRRGLKKE